LIENFIENLIAESRNSEKPEIHRCFQQRKTKEKANKTQNWTLLLSENKRKHPYKSCNFFVWTPWPEAWKLKPGNLEDFILHLHLHLEFQP